MKAHTITIERTVVSRQTVNIEANTKRDALLSAHAALQPEKWEDDSTKLKVVDVAIDQ